MNCNVISTKLLARFDQSGPRYTSYPTADRFSEAFTEADGIRALARRRGSAQPLSVYVHVPFCESVCHYCACNKVVTKHHELGLPYVHQLLRELELQTEHLGSGHAVSQLHLGGGTPTFLSDGELALLMQGLRREFNITPDAECAIEIDPRTVTHARLQHLHQLGFNRLSFGVQDLNPEVQKAVHRVQSFGQIQGLMASARQLGFASINIDLIYGLPLQTPATLAQTLNQLGQLAPDRIAMYGYAHLPQRFKPQRRIHDADLPPAASKLSMLHLALVMALMCQGRVDFESIELGHLVHVPTYFANELARLKDLEQQGLLVLGPSGIDITPTGWYLVRAIAMVFDKHLGQRSTQAEQTVRFSRVI